MRLGTFVTALVAYKIGAAFGWREGYKWGRAKGRIEAMVDLLRARAR